jgi:hypothetical protein
MGMIEMPPCAQMADKRPSQVNAPAMTGSLGLFPIERPALFTGQKHFAGNPTGLTLLRPEPAVGQANPLETPFIIEEHFDLFGITRDPPEADPSESERSDELNRACFVAEYGRHSISLCCKVYDQTLPTKAGGTQVPLLITTGTMCFPDRIQPIPSLLRARPVPWRVPNTREGKIPDRAL